MREASGYMSGKVVCYNNSYQANIIRIANAEPTVCGLQAWMTGKMENIPFNMLAHVILKHRLFIY